MLQRIYTTLFFLFVGLAVLSQTTPIEISVTKTTYSCKPATAKINISGGTAPFYCNWSNNFQGTTQNGLTPGNYNVSIVDGNGKDTLISFTIEEEECLVSISSAFSPNNDGINDTWGISKWENFPNFSVFVYNRWGQLVYSQKGGFEPWNGKQVGVDVPVGTYYYVFYYDGTDGKMEKGSITLMR